MTMGLLAERIGANVYRVRNVRSRLLDSALTMLRRTGVHHLNLRAIAAHAGVAASTVYYHYKNKEDLLGGLAQSGFEALGEAMAAAVESPGDGLQLFKALEAYVTFALHQPELYQLMYEIYDHGELEAVTAAEQGAFKVLARAVDADGGGRYLQEMVDTCSTAIWASGRGIAAVAFSANQGAEVDKSKVIQQALLGLRFLVSRRLKDAARIDRQRAQLAV